MARVRTVAAGLVASVLAVGAVGVIADEPNSQPRIATIVAAGDVAACSGGDTETAKILRRYKRSTVLTLGDNAYGSGSPQEYENCYAPHWGKFKNRTKPSPGNHDYGTANAQGYRDYFQPPGDYYAFDLGRWRLYSLNSETDISGQAAWLADDLRDHPHECVLAYWHRPLFSSGPHGYDPATLPFWQNLYAAHADVILNGHDHDYERFKPQAPDPDSPQEHEGIVEFVVGTGGASHYGASNPAPNSAVFNGETFGVLYLTLYAHSYGWHFVPIAGEKFTESGYARCVK